MGVASKVRGQAVQFFRRLTAIFVSVAALTAPTSAHALSLEEVGTFESPTYVTSDPGDPDRLFAVERSGRIQLTEGTNTTTFLDIEPLVLSPPEPGTVNNEGGLFSMAFSPDYATNQLFYVAYRSADDPDSESEDESGEWHLDEFTANGDTADPASRREVLTVEYPAAQLDDQFHYGGQLHFGPDRYLYASTGDGGPQGDPNGNAQDLESLLGKILRIDPEGSAPGEYTVPADNPFTGTAGCADGCDEIWSYGLRNPWRFSFDRLTGDLVVGDVGYTSWEEVDFEPGPDPGKGDNFGWNCREGAHPGPGESLPVCADRVGSFTEPVFEYPHVAFGPCSMTGGYVVRDPSLGDLYGRYLYADFCVGELRSLNLGLPTATGESEGLSVPLVTSFGEDAGGRIYVASLDGPVYRLTPTPGSPPSPDGGTGPGPVPLTLDLEPKKRKLRKLKFFATANVASTLVARGKEIKKTTKQLAANQETKVKAKLKRKARERLGKLEEKGTAKFKVEGTATTQSGAEATDTVKVKLKA